MSKLNLIIGAGILVVIGVLVFAMKGQSPAQDAASEQGLSAKQLYAQASDMKQEGEFAQAKESYQRILSDFSDFRDIEKVQKELEALNMDQIFSNGAIPDRTVLHEVQSGDTLGVLAKKHGTTIDLIRRSNHLTSDVIRVGQKLRIWTGTFNIYVDKSQNLLTLRDGDEVIKVYNISTGEGNITPIGNFEIATRLVDPVWFNKGIAVSSESPQNVLGSRWLGFDLPSYGIHGTVEPESIGKQVTAGCIRMFNEDVEELFSIIPRGTKVEVVD